MIKSCILSFLFLFSTGLIFALDTSIDSPDGKLLVTISVNNGSPVYTVSYNGKQFLKPSPLGMKTNIGDYSVGLVLKDTLITKKID